MKRLIIIHVFILIFVSTFSQKNPFRGCGSVTFNKGSGYMNINELHYGYGIAASDSPYGKQYYGFTTTHGYQLNIYNLYTNNSLLAGLSTGVFVYDGRSLIPLSLDIRFMANYKKISPFIYEVNGILVSIDEIKEQTRMFINPGVGVKIKINRLLSASFGAGLFVQMGDNVYRDSFFALRTGIIFKPK